VFVGLGLKKNSQKNTGPGKYPPRLRREMLGYLGFKPIQGQTLQIPIQDQDEFRGTNTPVAAVESSQLQNISIDETYWTVDPAHTTITSNEIFEQGHLFTNDKLQEIFTNLEKFLNASNKYNAIALVHCNIKLGDDFLSGYLGDTIDFSPIAYNIDHIGKGFLKNASNLKEFKDQGFSRLLTIEDDFLSGAKSLTSFDTNGFSQVAEIGYNFLKDSVKYDMKDFKSLRKLGDILRDTKTGRVRIIFTPKRNFGFGNVYISDD
jgi:hypothetical protein